MADVDVPQQNFIYRGMKTLAAQGCQRNRFRKHITGIILHMIYQKITNLTKTTKEVVG